MFHDSLIYSSEISFSFFSVSISFLLLLCHSIQCISGHDIGLYLYPLFYKKSYHKIFKCNYMVHDQMHLYWLCSNSNQVWWIVKFIYKPMFVEYFFLINMHNWSPIVIGFPIENNLISILEKTIFYRSQTMHLCIVSLIQKLLNFLFPNQNSLISFYYLYALDRWSL